MSDTPAPKSRRRVFRWIVAALLGAVVLLLAFVGWLVASQSGAAQSATWLARLTDDGVRLEGVNGALVGPLTIDKVRVRLPSLHVDIDQVSLDWKPSALPGQIEVASLEARRVALASTPAEDDTPAQAPAGFELPVNAVVDRLHVAQFAIAPFPLQEGAGEVLVSPLSGKATAIDNMIHLTVDEVATPWGGGQADVSLGTLAPMDLKGTARWTTEAAGPTVSTELTVGGVLEAIELAARASGAGANVRLEGVVTPFGSLPAARLKIEGEGIDPSKWREGLPGADFVLQADLTEKDGALSGPVSVSNTRAGTVDAGLIPLASLVGQLRANLTSASIDNLEAKTGGAGRVTGRASWAMDVPATAELSLAELNLKGVDGRLPDTALVGPISLSADAQTQRVQAKLADEGLKADLVAEHANARVHVEQLKLMQGEARAEATGEIALEGTMPFKADIKAQTFNPGALWADAPTGSITGDVAVSGQAGVPSASGQFKLGSSQLAGRPLGGQGSFEWNKDRLAQLKAWLAVGDNRLDAQGSWGAPGDVLEWQLDAPELGQLDMGVAGRVSLKGQLTGGIDRPAGNAEGSARNLSLPGAVRIGRAGITADLAQGVDGEFAVNLDVSDVRLSAENTLDTVALDLAGTRGRHVLDLNVKTPQDTASVEMQGGLTGDELVWEGAMTRLATTGRFPLKLQSPVTLTLASDQVTTGRARLSAGEGGSIILEPARWSPGQIVSAGRFTGLTVGLETQPDAPPRQRSGDLVLGGEWDVKLGRTAQGNARIFRESGDLILVGDTVVRFGLERFELIASIDNERLAASVDAAGKALGTLTGSATAQLERKNGLWQLNEDAALLGSADLDVPGISWVGALLSPVVRTDGQLKAQFNLSGTPAQPVGAGQINGENLVIEIPTEGLRLAGGTIDARFDAEKLDINTVRFVSQSEVRPRDSRVPYDALTRTPGTLTASGSIRLADGAGGLDFQANRFPLFQRADRWLAISGQGRMDTQWDAPRIEASMVADGGYLEFARSPAPSLGGDVVVVSDETEDKTSKPSQLKARVAIDLGSQLYLSALGLDTRLAGQLTLVANAGEPLRATGTLNTVAGTYEGYGQKLSIERGVVNFQGPLDNPGLNVVALRKGLEVEAGVSISGTVRRPVIALVSSPDVPDAEKLSWIVLGRSLDSEGGSGDLALLIPAAQALLGGPGGGITSQLQQGLGLDEFSIGQGDLNSVGRSASSSVVGSGYSSQDASVSGQVLSLGKRLSADTTLSFEQSLSGVEHVVKLTHQLSRRLAVIGRAGTDNAVDLQWSLSFR